MNLRDIHPLEYFNKWFAVPIEVSDYSVAGIVDAVNRHPMAEDQTAQDYVMPPNRYREKPRRFRIFGENQDVFYCFVRADDETQTDPPVYFETCLDLEIDHGFTKAEIIDNDHVLVCDRFTDFLWHMLGQFICIRLESSGLFASNVNGIVWDRHVTLDTSLINPLGREFPAGFTCWFSENVICSPDWGAAFLNLESRDSFVKRFKPCVTREWA